MWRERGRQGCGVMECGRWIEMGRGQSFLPGNSLLASERQFEVSRKPVGHWVCSPPPSHLGPSFLCPLPFFGSLNCLSSFSGSLPSLASPLVYRFLKATSSSLITLQARLPGPSSPGFFPCIGGMGMKQSGGVPSSGLLSTQSLSSSTTLVQG